LEQAIKTWEGGDLEETKTNLDQAIAMAEKIGYL
jgi:hypothetical protein